MWSQMRFTFVLCLIVVACEAKKKDKEKKMKGPFKDLMEKIEELEERMDGMGGGDVSGETCTGSNVHFFFHAEGASTDVDGKHVHIHISHTEDEHDHDHHDHDHDHDHHDHDHHHHHDDESAVCTMDSDRVKGNIRFSQVQESDGTALEVNVDLNYVPNADSVYAMHVHESGDVSKNCSNVGGHYDTDSTNDLDEGDLGRFTSDDASSIAGNGPYIYKHLSLYGHNTVVGRALVIHDEDGKKLDCCVIGWAKETEDDSSAEHHHH